MFKISKDNYTTYPNKKDNVKDEPMMTVHRLFKRISLEVKTNTVIIRFDI